MPDLFPRGCAAPTPGLMFGGREAAIAALASLEDARLRPQVSSCQAATLRHQVEDTNLQQMVSSWEVASLRLHAQHAECVQKQEAQKSSILLSKVHPQE